MNDSLAGLAVSYQPIDILAAHPSNARTHSQHQIRQIAASIRAFGFTNPVLIDRTNTIVAGHGRSMLGHLALVFSDDSKDDLGPVAEDLLTDGGYRIARALVRSDIYLNWRCARRGSVRGDLPDDTYHGVNAAYCDVFVTTELDQAEHARYASPNLLTAVYDGSIPLAEWLPDLLSQKSPLQPS